MNSEGLRRIVEKHKAQAALTRRVDGDYIPALHASTAHTGTPDFAGFGPRAGIMPNLSHGPAAAALAFSEPARRRARYQALNNPLARKGAATLTSHVVGTGIRPQINHENKALARNIEKRFNHWAKQSDPLGRQTFWQQQGATFLSTITGGDCLAQFRALRPASDTAPAMQIEPMEAELCPSSKYEPYGKNKILGGIEFMRNGRPVAFHMYPSHPGDGYMLNSLTTRRVPASKILHIIHMSRLGEVRGLPWFSAILPKLATNDGYDDAESHRKLIAANLSGYFKAPPGGDLSDLGSGQAPTGGGVNWRKQARMLQAVQAGTFPVLPPGWEVQMSQPGEVGGTYEAFMTTQHRIIAAGMPMLYELLTGDYKGLSDRTLRVMLQDFYRMCDQFTAMMIHQFCEPVYLRWLRTEVMLGRVVLPSGVTIIDLMPQWVPQGRPYIHPKQDAEAETLLIRAGLKSRRQAILERGGDIDQVNAEIAEERQEEARLGLALTTNPATEFTPSPNAPATNTNTANQDNTESPTQ